MNVKAVSGLGKGVRKSREGWFSRVVSLFDRATVAQPLWDDLEELLISADVGMATTVKLIDTVKAHVGRDKLEGGEQVLAVLKAEMAGMLSVGESERDNLDLLKTIKADERLQSIPVVVLAASDDVHTVNESFTLGAAGYMVKSGDGAEFAEKVRMIQTYWNLSELPRQR